VEKSKFRGSARNSTACGKMWALVIAVVITGVAAGMVEEAMAHLPPPKSVFCPKNFFDKNTI